MALPRAPGRWTASYAGRSPWAWTQHGARLTLAVMRAGIGLAQRAQRALSRRTPSAAQTRRRISAGDVLAPLLEMRQELLEALADVGVHHFR